MSKKIRNSILIAMFCTFGALSNMNSQSIAAGGYRSTFVCNDGTAKAVGKNEFGQLGAGPGSSSTASPVSVANLTGITAVAGIGEHCVFLKNNGTAWAAGYNAFGQLGDGTSLNRNIPTQVVGLTGINAVAGGQVHSHFLKNDGTVWAAGNNAIGQLGDGTTVNKSTAVQVSGLTGIIAIAAAYNHSLFVKNDGTVWAVGSNQFGQLGDGTTATIRTLPVQVVGLTGITAVTGGQSHSLFLKNDGTVWSVGSNMNGQLGDGTTLSKNTPVLIAGLTGIIAVAAGYNQSYFVKNDGTVWAVGRNQSGALGDGTNVDRISPVQVLGLANIISVAAGGLHAIFLRIDGAVYTVGLNGNGQLGDGNNVDKFTSIQVPGLCSALGIPEPSVMKAVYIYPNPCSDQLFIESEEYHNTIVEIFNLRGQLLQSIPLQTFKTTLQINHLTGGIYLVQVKNPKGMMIQKIVKY